MCLCWQRLEIVSLRMLCRPCNLVSLVSFFCSNMRTRSQGPIEDFPPNLEGFGYKFNEKGQLRSIANDGVFEFEVKPNDRAYNQARYEALGEVITTEVFELLQSEGKLEKIEIPLDADDNEPKSFIFASSNWESAKKLLVLIHGTGVVRAGQWSRRLIINEGLESGSQLPFIKRGQEEGYGILVLNTNYNFEREAGSQGLKKFIRHNERPEKHGEYVWENFVRKASANQIAFVAHSYGGVVLVHLAIKYAEEFVNRVFAVAFTDSVHYNDGEGTKSVGWKHLLKISQNWVSSSKDLDTREHCYPNEVVRVSAGTPKHESTSWSSFESIFVFFARLLAKGDSHGVVAEGSGRTADREECVNDRTNGARGVVEGECERTGAPESEDLEHHRKRPRSDKLPNNAHQNGHTTTQRHEEPLTSRPPAAEAAANDHCYEEESSMELSTDAMPEISVNEQNEENERRERENVQPQDVSLLQQVDSDHL